MIKYIICFIKGHKKYNPKALNGVDVLTINDAMGVKLTSINICERCGKVYSEWCYD